MKKPIKAAALLLLPSLALLSCSTAPQNAQIFIYDFTDPFIASFSLHIQDRLKDYLPFSLSYAERNQPTQNTQIINALSDKSTKLLIVNLVDRLAASAIIEKAEKSPQKPPVFFINREPLSDDLNPSNDMWVSENCYYVGSDPLLEGELQADIADTLFGGASNWQSSPYNKNHDAAVDVAILKGEQGHQDSEQRSRYCISRLRELGYTVNLLETVYCNWERSVAKTTMKTFYRDDIELLFSNNDEMALGAIEYLNENAATLKPNDKSTSFASRYFPIIGVDATVDGKAAIENGTLMGTVLNDSDKQSEVLLDLIHHQIDGKPIPDYASSSVVVNGNYYHVVGQKVTKDS